MKKYTSLEELHQDLKSGVNPFSESGFCITKKSIDEGKVRRQLNEFTEAILLPLNRYDSSVKIGTFTIEKSGSLYTVKYRGVDIINYTINGFMVATNNVPPKMRDLTIYTFLSNFTHNTYPIFIDILNDIYLYKFDEYSEARKTMKILEDFE